MRILEILVAKEDQAYKNIGDPTLLMGTFNVEEEELITATAIENNVSAEEFSKQLENTADDFDPFEILMRGAMNTDEPPVIDNEETLFNDSDYLRSALTYFSQSSQHQVKELETVEGFEIMVTPELRRRLDALLPEEAMPETEFLRLSPDKSFCMEEMKRSMQNNMEDTAWPQTQYLWPLHPILTTLMTSQGSFMEEQRHL